MTKEDVTALFAHGIQKFHSEIPIQLIKRNLEWITTQNLDDALYVVRLEIPFQEIYHKFGLFRENEDYKVHFVGKERKDKKKPNAISSM